MYLSIKPWCLRAIRGKGSCRYTSISQYSPHVWKIRYGKSGMACVIRQSCGRCSSSGNMYHDFRPSRPSHNAGESVINWVPHNPMIHDPGYSTATLGNTPFFHTNLRIGGGTTRRSCPENSWRKRGHQWTNKKDGCVFSPTENRGISLKNRRISLKNSVFFWKTLLSPAEISSVMGSVAIDSPSSPSWRTLGQCPAVASCWAPQTCANLKVNQLDNNG